MKKHLFAGALGAFAVIALTSCSAAADGSSASDAPSQSAGSFVYTESNATANEVLVFSRAESGTLTAVQKVSTGGAGTNGANAVTGETSSPDPLFSAGAVTLSDDHTLLFAVNAGDGSVSSFRVGSDGKLTSVNRVSTGEGPIPKSLSYDPKSKTLYVVHTFGPHQLTTLKVSDKGMLSDAGGAYTVNTATATDRVAVQAKVSPDGKFVLVDVVFDARPTAGGTLTPANEATKDGLVVFPIKADGSLGEAVFNDAGGALPFTLTFLNGSSTKLVNAVIGSNGAVYLTLNPDGTVTPATPTAVDLSLAPAGPSETCWIAFSPDNKFVFGTNFGFGTVSSFSLAENKLTLLDGAAASEPSPDGFTSLAGVTTSGPGDSWVSSDGYFYQLYSNADKLVGYKIGDSGGLTQVTSVTVPHNSTTGLAGF